MKLRNVLMTVMVLASTSPAFAGYQFIERCIGDDQGIYSFTHGYAGSGSNPEEFSYPAKCLNDNCSLKKVTLEDTEVVAQVSETPGAMESVIRTAGNVTLVCVSGRGTED